MPRLRTHPREILREEYLVPLDMSASALARLLGVPPNCVTEIVRGTRDITADTAIRLGRYFGTDPRFWLNLQGRIRLIQGREDAQLREDRAAEGGVNRLWPVSLGEE